MCFWLSHRLPGRSEPQATVASTTVNDCKRVPSHISTVVNKLNPPCRQGPVHNLDLGTWIRTDAQIWENIWLAFFADNYHSCPSPHSYHCSFQKCPISATPS